MTRIFNVLKFIRGFSKSNLYFKIDTKIEARTKPRYNLTNFSRTELKISITLLVSLKFETFDLSKLYSINLPMYLFMLLKKCLYEI